MTGPAADGGSRRPGRTLRASRIAFLRRLGVPWARLLTWIEERDWDEGAVLMVFAAVIGIGAGLGVVAFYHLIDLAYFLFISLPSTRLGAVQHAIYRPLLTAAGLLAAWALVRRFHIPDGQTVPDVQLAVAKRGARIDMGPVAVRMLASAATLGAGGSAGSEGPVAVLGAGLGSVLGRVFRFQQRRVKILVGCGAAAGISAAFNAPFAGAFFALEEVLGSFSIGAFSPVVIASVVGALVVRPFLGAHPAFHIPPHGEIRPLAIVTLYPLLGIICGLWSALYTRMFFRTADLFKEQPGPEWLRPVAGGLFVGIIVLLSGSLLVGDGHLAIPTPVFGGIVWYLLIALALGKTVATAVTLGSGGSGGVFTPTLFIGAALGGGLGRLANDLLPHFGLHPAAWGLVGMAGLVAGANRAPITAIFMVFEMTDDYGLVIPLMIVSVISYATARAFAPYGLYDGWLERRGEHLAHGADRALMDRIPASEALDARAVSVPPDAPLAAILEATTRTRLTTIPVVADEDRSLVGVITYEALRHAMLEHRDLDLVLLAADLAEPSEVVHPSDSLRTALRLMNSRALDALPVVDGADPPHFLGVLSRADLLTSYERQLVHEV